MNEPNEKSFTEKAKDALPSTDTWKEVGKYVGDKLMTVVTVIAGVATYAWLSTRSK
jgi:hypothetical protein